MLQMMFNINIVILSVVFKLKNKKTQWDDPEQLSAHKLLRITLK